MREIKSRNAANIILYISSEMGLSDRTEETGLARFRSPAIGLRGHELSGVRRTSRRAPPAPQRPASALHRDDRGPSGQRIPFSRKGWESAGLRSSSMSFDLRSMRPLVRCSMRPSCVRLYDGRLRQPARTSLAGAMLKPGPWSVLEVVYPVPRCELQPAVAGTTATVPITW